MIGTSFSPRCRAASSRPWPATISPSSDTITGAVQPYSTSDAAILATWSSEWVRAFLEYGFRRATGHCSICSGRKRSEVIGVVLKEGGKTVPGLVFASRPIIGDGGHGLSAQQIPRPQPVRRVTIGVSDPTGIAPPGIGRLITATIGAIALVLLLRPVKR